MKCGGRKGIQVHSSLTGKIKFSISSFASKYKVPTNFKKAKLKGHLAN